jgi:hypothetical protein
VNVCVSSSSSTITKSYFSYSCSTIFKSSHTALIIITKLHSLSPHSAPTHPTGLLLHYDQLSHALRLRNVLAGFTEAPITFPPSYKWNTAR